MSKAQMYHPRLSARKSSIYKNAQKTGVLRSLYMPIAQKLKYFKQYYMRSQQN